MPVGDGPQQLIRRVVGVRGSLRLRLELEPRVEYGRTSVTVERTREGVVFRAPGLALGFAAPVALESTAVGVAAEFEPRGGDSRTFVLETAHEATPVSEADAEKLMRETAVFWRGWLGRSSYHGRWREMVHRSALTSKLLTYKPTGAVLAAPTTSLPERIGGARNWDYRFAWVRDFSFSVYALSRLGFTNETAALNSLRRAISRPAVPTDSGSPLRVMYRIDGGSDLDEQELSHLEGYAGSGPVRIGNNAAGQLQLDIYGELFDSIYLG